MTTRVPQTVRQAWGDELVLEFVPWLEQVIEEKTFPRLKQLVEEKAVPRDEYRQVLSRLDVLEHDVADIKVDVRELRAEMNERFDRVNERFDQMGQRFEVRLDQMSERMLVQTRWLIGSIALFGTILTILQAIAQFTP
jgi:hypothetical protein